MKKILLLLSISSFSFSQVVDFPFSTVETKYTNNKNYGNKKNDLYSFPSSSKFSAPAQSVDLFTKGCSGLKYTGAAEQAAIDFLLSLKKNMSAATDPYVKLSKLDAYLFSFGLITCLGDQLKDEITGGATTTGAAEQAAAALGNSNSSITVKGKGTANFSNAAGGAGADTDVDMDFWGTASSIIEEKINNGMYSEVLSCTLLEREKAFLSIYDMFTKFYKLKFSYMEGLSGTCKFELLDEGTKGEDISWSGLIGVDMENIMNKVKAEFTAEEYEPNPAFFTAERFDGDQDKADAAYATAVKNNKEIVRTHQDDNLNKAYLNDWIEDFPNPDYDQSDYEAGNVPGATVSTDAAGKKVVKMTNEAKFNVLKSSSPEFSKDVLCISGVSKPNSGIKCLTTGSAFRENTFNKTITVNINGTDKELSSLEHALISSISRTKFIKYAGKFTFDHNMAFDRTLLLFKKRIKIEEDNFLVSDKFQLPTRINLLWNNNFNLSIKPFSNNKLDGELLFFTSTSSNGTSSLSNINKVGYSHSDYTKELIHIIALANGIDLIENKLVSDKELNSIFKDYTFISNYKYSENASFSDEEQDILDKYPNLETTDIDVSKIDINIKPGLKDNPSYSNIVLISYFEQIYSSGFLLKTLSDSLIDSSFTFDYHFASFFPQDTLFMIELKKELFKSIINKNKDMFNDLILFSNYLSLNFTNFNKEELQLTIKRVNDASANDKSSHLRNFEHERQNQFIDEYKLLINKVIKGVK